MWLHISNSTGGKFVDEYFRTGGELTNFHKKDVRKKCLESFYDFVRLYLRLRISLPSRIVPV